MKEFFKKSLRITAKVFKWILIVFIFLFILIFVIWKVPAVHQYAVNKGTSFFNEKTGGDLSIGHVDLKLPFFIGLEDISLLTPDGSKLASIESLEIYPGWRMLFANTIRVDEINLSGIEGKIFVNKSSDFNFDFIIDGFSDTTAAPTEPQDTTASAWGFSLGDLNISELGFIFADRTTGDSIDIHLGNFELDMDELDLENQAYVAESILLENSAVYAQITATEESPDSSSSNLLPRIGLDELEISNAIVELKLGDDPAYKFDLGELFLETDEIDLNENKYLVEEFTLTNSRFYIPLPPTDSTQTSAEPNSADTPSNTDSFFPDLTALVGEIFLENIQVRAFTGADTLHTLSNLAITAEDIEVGSNGYSINLEELAGSYNDFQGLREFRGDFALTNSTAKAEGVTLFYGESNLNMHAKIDYKNVDAFLSQFKFDLLDIDINETRIAAKDIEKIYAIMEMDSLPLPGSDIFINMEAKGNMQSIDLENLRLKTGSSFVKLIGNATSIGDSLWPGNLSIQRLEVNLIENDLIPYTNYLGVDTAQIPPSLNLQLSGKYNSRKAKANGLLKTPYGEVGIDLAGDGWSNSQQGIAVTLNSDQVRIGDYLKLSEELNTDFSVLVESENLNDSILHLCADLSVDTLNYRGKEFTQLDLDVDMLGNEIQYAFAIEDTFAKASLGGTLDFSSGIDALVSGTVSGIDLQGLGYAEKDIRGKIDLKASFKQDSLSTMANVLIDEILFVKEGDRFPLEPLKAEFYTGDDSTSANIEGGFIQLSSVSNRSIDSLTSVIAETIARGESEAVNDSTAFWNATLTISDLTEIGELFLPQLGEFKPSMANIIFNTQDNKLLAEAVFPGIEYGAFDLDSLLITTTDAGDVMERRLSIKRMAYDTLGVDDLKFELDRIEKGAKVLLTINPDTSDNFYRIGANLVADSIVLKNGFTFQFADTMVLNGKQWYYEDSCAINSNIDGITFREFRLYRDERVIQLEKEESDSPLNIIAENFPMHALTGMFNTEEKVFNGIINGQVSLNNDGTFEGEGDITTFQISGADFGTLSWRASKENNNFKTFISTKGDHIDLVLDGDILPQNDSLSALDLDIELNRLDLQLLEVLVANNIDEASGTLSGDIAIEGTTDTPQLSGFLRFKNALIRPTDLNAGYTVKDEQIEITPKGLKFSQFTVTDKNGSNLSIDGTVEHKEFTDPQLNLRIESKDFTLVDIAETAISPIHGKLVADLNLGITGPPTAPIVDAKVKINEPTYFSYIVTGSAEVEAFDESLLIWTNFEKSSDNEILTRRKEEQGLEGNIFASNPKIKGELTIDKSAIFQVVVDSSAGDYLQIQGSGKLGIDYDRTGALRFNGVYEVTKGFYQMTFYDIQKKKFDFMPGSKLVWNGEPTNANIDITASYKTRAGISNLMLIDGSTSYDEAFQQQLPFEVLLNVDGKLLEPRITFDIILAEEAQGALSGSVEGKLNDLRENESRLNKQVFALLILGTFLPQDGGSDSNVLANQARNSASQILTNQLNSLSDKYVKGVDINFDMYSYGGATGQGNTDLSVNLAKSFADDRIIVKVGSTVAIEDGNSGSAQSSQQQFMTNIEVEYKLTPDGRYRLLVFSKTDLEDIVIGRITRSGGGFVFQKDFDRFRYIFRQPEEDSQNTNEQNEIEE
ncbi:translocation/assembly module TamB domain-containing protein [Cryomorphaceae bacterium 1068]|nr:translocation/assembly module TamB domain-containing protein [Cryomorphaceae bacterium 1068]